jgi:hypothetical protein
MPTLRGPANVLLLLAIVCAFSLLYQLFRTQRRTLYITGFTVVLWFLIIGEFALHGFFSNFTTLPPHLIFALILPAIAFAIFSFTSKSLPQALSQTPITWLIAFQAFRIVVEIILWRGYKLGVVPIQMTFDGRNVDILIGITAPLAAWLAARFYKQSGSVTFGILWNIAGLASLINIATVAILSMPTPLRHFMNDPPNTLLTHFPFIYLPAVLVPAGYIAHMLSIRQLLQRRSIPQLLD